MEVVMEAVGKAIGIDIFIAIDVAIDVAIGISTDKLDTNILRTGVVVGEIIVYRAIL
jgi:hypothetical protein